ncbi:MAG: hypothetical protein ACRDMI_05755 [Streptosporangiaceae bacterium]
MRAQLQRRASQPARSQAFSRTVPRAAAGGPSASVASATRASVASWQRPSVAWCGVARKGESG